MDFLQLFPGRTKTHFHFKKNTHESYAHYSLRSETIDLYLLTEKTSGFVTMQFSSHPSWRSTDLKYSESSFQTLQLVQHKTGIILCFFTLLFKIFFCLLRYVLVIVESHKHKHPIQDKVKHLKCLPIFLTNVTRNQQTSRNYLYKFVRAKYLRKRTSNSAKVMNLIFSNLSDPFRHQNKKK